MARGIIRKPSFNKIVGAYRSQWKRFWRRLFTFGIYGSKGIGWWKNPKKAWYNFWYYRTSISVYRILGCKPSRGACLCAMLIASVVSIFTAPVDVARAGVKAQKIKKMRKARDKGKTARSTTAHKSTHKKPHAASYDQSKKSHAAKTSSQDKSTVTRTASSTGSYGHTSIKASQKTAAASTNTATPNAVEEKRNEAYDYSFSSLFQKDERPVHTKTEEPKDPDESIPKSKPKPSPAAVL